jgi:uncharacterized membrane protein
MEPKRSKYDTNPLDGKVAGRAQESFESARPGPPTEKVAGGPTRDIGRTANEEARLNPEREAPTQRIDDATSYPSVFVPPPPRQSTAYAPPRAPAVNIYQPPPAPLPSVYLPPPLPIPAQKPGSRHVTGLGIPEKWANMLPYFFGHIGLVAAIVELLLVPRTETRARFHAAQGMALQIAILILTGAFGFVHLISGNALGSRLFGGAATIFLIVSMVRAWKGKPHHIAPLDEATKFFDEKIKPRK